MFRPIHTVASRITRDFGYLLLNQLPNPVLKVANSILAEIMAQSDYPALPTFSPNSRHYSQQKDFLVFYQGKYIGNLQNLRNFKRSKRLQADS